MEHEIDTEQLWAYLGSGSWDGSASGILRELLVDYERLKKANNIFADVRAFLAVGHPHMLADMIGFPNRETEDLCIKLVKEEYEELREAVAANDIVETADAIADLIWVAICLAFACGIPIEDVWREVARSNMAKFPNGVVLRRPEDGKILKPEGWSPPDIAGVLRAAALAKGCVNADRDGH